MQVCSSRLFFLFNIIKNSYNMEQLKLKDLYNECRNLMKKGYGDKSLIMAGDNEGNFYHGMFFSLTPITPKNVKEFEGLIEDNTEKDLTNILIVG